MTHFNSPTLTETFNNNIEYKLCKVCFVNKPVIDFYMIINQFNAMKLSDHCKYCDKIEEDVINIIDDIHCLILKENKNKRRNKG